VTPTTEFANPVGSTLEQIEVVVGQHELVVVLDVDAAPGLTSALLRALPHSSLAVHCQTAGAEFCVPVPFFHWHENRRPPTSGDVGYASFGNYLCFYYGPMVAMDGPTNVIGRLSSSAHALEALGALLLKTGAQMANIQNHARPGTESASLPPFPSRTTAFARMSRTLLESSLASPPEDIAHLRGVKLPAMGNMAGRLQASVLLLSLSEALMNARTLAPDFPHALPTVVACLVAQMGRYSRWLAMAGLPATAAWLEITRDVLRDETLRADEFVAGLEEALVAIGRLRFWAEAVSPWHRVTEDYAAESNWTNHALP
jgi:hypothetical protein